MSTQIYINPNTCKPEFTKIAAHSFSFVPEYPAPLPGLYSGGYNGPEQATWSRDNFNYNNTILAPIIKQSDKAIGISLPINLVSDDIVTLSGTIYFNNTALYINAGYDVSLILGVYYFKCQENEPTGYTFIPVESFAFENNSVCFATSVTLGSNFDIHNTRFLVGFNIGIDCPTMCLDPAPENNLATVSYTLDIERPCAVITSESNFIIRNCCEPIITELVNIAGLTVGSFHVDDEGNCWEVISSSNDVTNFTRNFIDLYGSCTDCITANPCPQNLMIKSCCVTGQEYVTGSLPGLNAGDTFVDNNGLCWYVDAETGAPISEESITVVTEIIGDCTVCTAANPCPDFWKVKSCCGQLQEIIATTTVLNFQDSFVDTNGICWNVDSPATSLPTNYGIVVDTVYPGPMGACTVCITANPCPTEYFITVRACCDNDRIEVISVPTVYMSFSEGSIFSDNYGVCWEVMSYSTTGVETYPIAWGTAVINTYTTCDSCISAKGKATCIFYWKVRDCATDIVYTVSSNSSPASMPTIGSFYKGTLFTTPGTVCFEVLGYGYPQSGVSGQLLSSPEFGSCEECQTPPPTSNFREVTLCCNGQTIIVNFGTYVLPFPPAPVYVYDLTHTLNPSLSGNYCCTVGNPVVSVLTPWEYNNVITAFGNCSACTMMYPSCP